MCSVGRHVASTTQVCSKQDARCAQAYSRDVLAFVFAALTLVAAWTSTAKARAVVLLNRQQTEEWKGWMQARAAHNALPALGGQQTPARPSFGTVTVTVMVGFTQQRSREWRGSMLTWPLSGET